MKGEISDLIGFVLSELGSRWVIMRDSDLASRCRSFLEQYGTRIFMLIGGTCRYGQAGAMASLGAKYPASICKRTVTSR